MLLVRMSSRVQSDGRRELEISTRAVATNTETTEPKYHINIFGWDKFEQTNGDLMQTAHSLCTVRNGAETIKEQLPMFNTLSDATLDDLAREGRLPHVLSRFLEPATEPRLRD